MEDELCLSDSDGEQDKDDHTKILMSNLKGLSASNDVYKTHKSSNPADNKFYIPENLHALYAQIESKGFIPLQCQGSRCRPDTIRRNELHSVNNNINHTTLTQATSEDVACEMPTTETTHEAASEHLEVK